MKDFEEREEELEEDFASGGATVMAHKVSRVFRIIFYTFVYTIIALIMLRMCTNGSPAEIDTMIVNDRLAELYAESGNSLSVFNQKYDEYTIEEDKNYGYFGITKSVIIPDAEQIQIVFRYNRSTLEYLPQDYPELCPEVPSRDELHYDVSLVKVIDLTPENKEDNDKEEFLKFERYFPTKELTVAKQKGLHNYFRYVFEDISTDDALAVYVDIYYNKAIDYEGESYGQVKIYDKSRSDHIYTLSSRDKKALKNYGKK